MKSSIILACVPLLILLGLSRVSADDSLPPLKDGKAPTTLDELWGNYDPRLEPLEVEVLKDWEDDGVVCRLLRYQVGIFKGVPVKMAAFYAFPKGGTKLPAILEMHGGGQSAGLDGVVADAKNGYAGISINWGGNKLNFGHSKMAYDGPQTDWGKLDATHPPQRNQVNHFVGSLSPDEYTLDASESPRNSNWFLVLLAARRALTSLEQQPEVDPARIGASGHSMGGKLTTDLAGIDRRVKAAVPSCGGAGVILDSQASELPGCTTSKPSAMELNCVADNAYIPRIACPILWLSPANDFHGAINNMAWNWRTLPDSLVAFSIAPHLNHRHTAPHAITRLLWFEQHLKGACKLPGTPKLQLDLSTKDGVPGVTVTPDQPATVKSVEIYYSIGLNEKIRFWREAKEIRNGDVWSAACPIMGLDDPVFIYANVSYATPERYQKPAAGEASDWFTLSSRMLTATSAQLTNAGVKATDLPDRMIDDGSRGWADWFQLNWGHPPLWTVTTRKLTDPKWRGPDGGKLVFETRCESDNTLVIKFNCNGWGAYQPGKPAVDYVAVKELKGSPDWQTVSVAADDTVALDPAITGPIPNWQTVTEFSLCPTGETVKNGAKVTVGGKAWNGPRVTRNLHWEGGVDGTRRPADSKLSAEEDHKQSNTELSANTFTLSFDNDGRPAACQRKTDGVEFLRAGNGGQGFYLKSPDAALIRLNKLSLQPDGRLSARSDDGAKEVLFRVTHGQRHLALRIERVVGVPPERLDELHFEMNSDPRLRVLDLDYMTQADNWDYGVRVAWPAFWHRSPQDPLGGFAIYEKTDDNDEDATLLRLWVEEKLPHPIVAGAWTVERARQWIDDWQHRFANRDQLMLAGKSIAELHEGVEFAQRAGLKQIYILTDTWRTDAFWPVTDLNWGVNRAVFPRGETDLREFSDFVRGRGMYLALHYVSGGIGLRDPLYVGQKPDRRFASWGGGRLTREVGAADTTLIFEPGPGVVPPARHRPAYPHFFDWNLLRVGDELVRIGTIEAGTNGIWNLNTG